MILRDRTLREVDFSHLPQLTLGGFRAIDFFHDGSFYLLDTPGHDIGHLAGLARTSRNPDTFIFMGGDICVHNGAFRPTTHLPLPDSDEVPSPSRVQSLATACPKFDRGHALNAHLGRKENSPFFDAAVGHDMAQANKTLEQSQLLDAMSNVFCIFSHDMTIEEVVDFFPKAANEWEEKGWRKKTMWSFLSDLALAAKTCSTTGALEHL